jgi:hypothetical protein
MAWVLSGVSAGGGAVIGGALGLAGSLYGQQSQAEAQREANLQNLALWREQNRADESRYGFDIGRQDEMTASRRAREEDINRQLREQYGVNVARLDPYSQAGQAASTEQQALLGLSGAEAQESAMGRFTESPAQAWLKRKAQKELLRGASQIGGLGGGNVRTALQEQGTMLAQQDYDRQLERLAAVSGRGQQAAGTIGQLAPSYVQTGADIGVGETPYEPQAQ